MKLENLALIILCIGGVLWGVFMAFAMVPAFMQVPFLWPVAVLVIAVGVYFFGRVIRDRLTNEEDDYYDRLP